MDGLILPLVFILLPALLVLVLRSSGTLVFLSVCLGSVLATYVAGDASSVISSATPDDGSTALRWAQLGLVLAPVFLTIVLTRKKAKGGELVLGLLAAIAAGGLLMILATPFMPEILGDALLESELWATVDNLQTAVVIAGSALYMAGLFMARHDPDSKHKKHA